MLDNQKYFNLFPSEGESKKTANGVDYTGTSDVTMTGKPCQRWDASSPHAHSFRGKQFPDVSLGDAANFCRNPGGVKPFGPWCFTTNSSVEWEYCDIDVKREYYHGEKHSNTNMALDLLDSLR